MLRPCRVLVLNERDLRHPKAGGAETHVFEIMSRLAARGFEISLLASGFAGGASEECVEGVDVRRLGALALYYPSAAVACARGTRRDRFDVVVEAGETGFLVPTCDVEAFAERIGALLRADAAGERMSSAALGWSQRFDWNLAADQMALAIGAAYGGS
jgi:hypothetical protein